MNEKLRKALSESEFTKRNGNSIKDVERGSEYARRFAFTDLLESAICNGDVAECKWLMANAKLPDISQMTFRREFDNTDRHLTPLQTVAAFCRSSTAPDMIRFLTDECGLDPNATGTLNLTPIQIAAAKANEAAMCGMLESEADVFGNLYGNATNGNVIFRAIRHDDDMSFFEFVMNDERIASRINDVFPWGMYKIPPLFVATDELKKLRHFLDFPGTDATVKAQDSDSLGMNAIHWIFKNYSGRNPWKEKIKILRKAGASLSEKDSFGNTPFEYAKENSNFTKEEKDFLERETLADSIKNAEAFKKKRKPAGSL